MKESARIIKITNTVVKFTEKLYELPTVVIAVITLSAIIDITVTGISEKARFLKLFTIASSKGDSHVSNDLQSFPVKTTQIKAQIINNMANIRMNLMLGIN